MQKARIEISNQYFQSYNQQYKYLTKQTTTLLNILIYMIEIQIQDLFIPYDQYLYQHQITNYKKTNDSYKIQFTNKPTFINSMLYRIYKQHSQFTEIILSLYLISGEVQCHLIILAKILFNKYYYATKANKYKKKLRKIFKYYLKFSTYTKITLKLAIMSTSYPRNKVIQRLIIFRSITITNKCSKLPAPSFMQYFHQSKKLLIPKITTKNQLVF
eukprot:TRINITY_DN13855_c0_g1_i1.p2 TRINITY_DN13855_c0_g1~~TRINITY_DN13855_c0_g1_i1.p2  ORF type:complete len:215 (+),score=-15.61 TRINITY_DN13855_c0_g1_i1:7-651(+)